MFDKVKSIFDINNSFFQFGRKLLWVFILNILFILTSIPIITIGASSVAMNKVFLKIINEQDFSFVEDYFGTFKENFLKSTAVWIISVILGFILYVDVFYWFSYGIEDGIYGYFMLIVSIIVSLFFIMMVHAVFPIIARFEMTFKELILNTFVITLKHWLYGIEAVISTTIIVGITFYMIFTGKFLIMFYLILLCFGLNGLIQSYIYRRVLNRYSEDYIEMVKRNDEEM